MKSGVPHSHGCRRFYRWLSVLLLQSFWFGGNGAIARAGQGSTSPPTPTQAPATDNPPAAPPAIQVSPPPPPAAKASPDAKVEVSSKDTATTFKLRVNLVQVRVVVRDSKGNLINGLKREDFQLYDQGKPQTISTFGIETAKTRVERAEAAAKTQQADPSEPEQEKAVIPQRFVALAFDDIHLNMSDAVFSRNAAKALIAGLAATDRLAIYTTSGQVGQEFTNDKAALENVLLKIVPRPKMGKINNVSNCPDVNHYMADEAINKNDPQVLQVVAAETLQCMFGNDPRMMSAALTTAQTSLQAALTAGDTDNDFTYRVLEDILRRMSSLPGERVLVLASPGFLITTRTLDESGIIDRANRASVVINTLDARGLYTPDLMGDIAQSQSDTVATAGYKSSYRIQEQIANEYVLSDIAYGTGGTFFHNSNDLAGGLKRAGEAPEISYVLGFSPQNQKMDGRYHVLKVTMSNKMKYDIQARRGYYAPRKVEDPGEQAKQEIAEAVFSQEEIHDLPLDLQTQYFKTGENGVHLSVVSHIDVKSVHFRKAEGRNWDELTVATVIFDENGNYVTGGEKLLQMRLLDTTYARMSQSGLLMKSSFDVKPGKYMIRQVVRDSEGAQMAARNGAVVIPY
jgi:VWFA-related protein